MKAWLEKLELGAEELILALLIIIEALDFFTIIPAPLEFAEKTTAIIAMCYLFYKASITKIVSGKREKLQDIMIVVAYLLISIKTVIGFIISAAEEKTIMMGTYHTILQNVDAIEKTGFWLGGLILIGMAVVLVREKVKKPSIMDVLHETKKADTAGKKLARGVTTYLVLLAIFVVVFAFAIEWLAITVDAPIIMIILFFYLFVIVKQGKNMKTESFLKKVSETSEEFYQRFISMLHERRTVATAITGLLVLHLLVDIGHFIIPYTTGLLYPWYFKQLGPGHEPLATHMAQDFALAGGAAAQTGVMLVYTLNVLSILMLFFGPAYAWAKFYSRKKTAMPRITWLFFGSLAVFIMQPVFNIGRVKTAGLLGVDITTQQIPNIQNTWSVLLIAGLVAAIFYLLERKNPWRTRTAGFLAVFIYFGIYLYHFFTDLAAYYVKATTAMAQNELYFIAAHLLIFFTITIIFYIGGYILFLHKSYIQQKI